MYLIATLDQFEDNLYIFLVSWRQKRNNVTALKISTFSMPMLGIWLSHRQSVRSPPLMLSKFIINRTVFCALFWRKTASRRHKGGVHGACKVNEWLTRTGTLGTVVGPKGALAGAGTVQKGCRNFAHRKLNT